MGRNRRDALEAQIKNDCFVHCIHALANALEGSACPHTIAGQQAGLYWFPRKGLQAKYLVKQFHKRTVRFAEPDATFIQMLISTTIRRATAWCFTIASV
jgi:hypothetical protein